MYYLPFRSIHAHTRRMSYRRTKSMSHSLISWRGSLAMMTRYHRKLRMEPASLCMSSYHIRILMRGLTS